MSENKEPSFRRFTRAERQTIERLLDANAAMSEIARKLGRSVSSITREIRRNRRDDGYRVSPVSITAAVRAREDMPGQRALQGMLEQAVRGLPGCAVHEHLRAL